MIFRNILLTIPFLLTAVYSNETFSQAKTVNTRQFEADDWLSKSLNMQNNGILLFGWEEKTKFVMKAIDTELEDYASWSVSTAKKATLADILYNPKNEQVVALLQTSKSTYDFVVVDVKSKKKKTTSLSLAKGTSIRETMYLVDDEIWLVGFTKKASFMYKLSIATPRLSPLDPHISADKFSISTIEVLNNNEVAISYFYGPKKMRELDVTVLNSKGKTLVKNLLGSVTQEQRKLIINASTTRLAEGDYAITGTYNKKGNSTGNGIYFARYSDGKVRYLSNFDYSDFEHFFDHLTGKRKEKIETKIAKKKGKGKEVTLHSLSVMHKAIPMEEGLVFVGEYYYPTYRTETSPGPNGTTTTTQVFDGYQYTHGMAVGIDNNGKKLYDLSIPLHIRTKPFTVVRFLSISSDSSIITLLHTSGRLVYSSKIEENNITNNEYSFINKISENEKEKWTSSNSMHWYENYYFVMEVQKTKEKGLGGKKQTKYYAVKVEVQD